ncbi:MAG: sulfatase-like hydrolase/transferase [Saprospiraceae bacterium]|nr:sulfatase-like hydrolase/transferase [Saprospiraceae bacterium]
MTLKNKFSSLYFPVKLMVFYFFGLNFWRGLFIWFNGADDVLQPLMSAVRLDLSMICGAILIGLVPWVLYMVMGWEWLRKANLWLHLVIWIGICLVEWGGVLIYKEWGSTLDSRALSYLHHPKEAWASVRDFIPFWVLFWGLVITVSGIKRLLILFDDWQPVRSHVLQSSIFMILVGPLSFLGLRGGWQKLPIVPSDAYYSEDMKNNFAATNKTWYLAYSMVKSSNILLYNDEKSIHAFRDNYQENKVVCMDSLLLSDHNKNIVLLVMEGWSADMVKYLGGKENITPFFDSLSNVSYRFTNAFSTGFRTDQGLMSVLSGIPSVRSINMPNVIDKVQYYPSLPMVMKKDGRTTSFIYGGDLNFSNLYNYVTVMGFDTIIRDKDFDDIDISTEWGVPDHLTAEKAMEVISKDTSRFFSTILFLSSHSPFEVPWKNEYSDRSDIPSLYKSSVKYSDQSMKYFFNMAQGQSWFNNTIFIITSDHGSTHSGFAGLDDHNRFRIPLLIFDPSKTDSLYGKGDMSSPCNHFDLPATIAGIAGANADSFLFSRNILCNDRNRKAYWNTDVSAACYGLNKNNIQQVQGADKKLYRQDAVLFVDMVIHWFSHL